MNTTNVQMTATGNVSNVEATLKEIVRRKNSKRDYIVPAQKMRVIDGRLDMGTKLMRVDGAVYTEWADAEKAADAKGARIETVDAEAGGLELSRHALNQLANDLHCPVKYLDFLRGEAKLPDLADDNLTRLLKINPAKQLVRTLDGKVRAYLSNGYRVMDNADVFFAAANTLVDADAPIWHARLWDNGFELLAVSRKITEAVLRSPNFQPNAPHAWADGGRMGDQDGNGGLGKIEDMHRAMVKITNSETGAGGLTVTMGIFRDACNNTAVVGKTLRAIHLGQRNTSEGLVNYSEDTKESESKTIWLKLRDSIQTAFDAGKFKEAVAKLQGLTSVDVPNAEKAVDNVIEGYEISEERKALILANLIGGRDLTGFGVVQAVTATAHELDKQGNAEAASEMERLGGVMMEAPKRLAEMLVA